MLSRQSELGEPLCIMKYLSLSRKASIQAFEDSFEALKHLALFLAAVNALKCSTLVSFTMSDCHSDPAMTEPMPQDSASRTAAESAASLLEFAGAERVHGFFDWLRECEELNERGPSDVPLLLASRMFLDASNKKLRFKVRADLVRAQALSAAHVLHAISMSARWLVALPSMIVCQDECRLRFAPPSQCAKN